MGKDDYKKRLTQTGRNDLCLCGSGKKYKKCHLGEDEASERAESAAVASEREATQAGTDPDEQNGNKTNKWRNERQKVGRARSGSNTHPNIPRRGAV